MVSLPVPPVVIPPAPAECLRRAFEAYPEALSKLPPEFPQLSPPEQQRALLRLKADDASLYLTLRDTALRCAPPR